MCGFTWKCDESNLKAKQSKHIKQSKAHHQSSGGGSGGGGLSTNSDAYSASSSNSTWNRLSLTARRAGGTQARERMIPTQLSTGRITVMRVMMHHHDGVHSGWKGTAGEKGALAGVGDDVRATGGWSESARKARSATVTAQSKRLTLLLLEPFQGVHLRQSLPLPMGGGTWFRSHPQLHRPLVLVDAWLVGVAQ
jgi:hypothetical protein